MTESRPDAADAEPAPPERNLFQIAYNGNDDEIKTFIAAQVQAAMGEYKFDDYLLLFLFDEWNIISNHHADRLYEAASTNTGRNIFLFLHSNGGSIEPAYLISKSLKRLTREKFGNYPFDKPRLPIVG